MMGTCALCGNGPLINPMYCKECAKVYNYVDGMKWMKYTDEKVMKVFNCPDCGLEIALIEEGGPKWNVCRNENKTQFAKPVEMVSNNGTLQGPDITLYIAQCDCGNPIFVCTSDEREIHEWNITGCDFIPKVNN